MIEMLVYYLSYYISLLDESKAFVVSVATIVGVWYCPLILKLLRTIHTHSNNEDGMKQLLFLIVSTVKLHEVGSSAYPNTIYYI